MFLGDELRLEGEASAHLEDALGACGRGDLAEVTVVVVATYRGRRAACSGVGEVDPVQEVGGLAAELEYNSALQFDVAEKAHVELFETGPKEAVAAYVAVRAAWADAACQAGPVGCVSCRIKPRSHLVRPGPGGANAAAIVGEHGVLAGNSIRALVAGAVEALVGPCGCLLYTSPTDRGAQIRTLGTLKELHKRHEIHLDVYKRQS